MAVKKPNDPTYDFVMSIYMQHVPSQSELTNPFSANKRQRKTKLVTKVAKELPDDLGTWSSRNFVFPQRVSLCYWVIHNLKTFFTGRITPLRVHARLVYVLGPDPFVDYNPFKKNQLRLKPDVQLKSFPKVNTYGMKLVNDFSE
jgi:hypothetical protein